MAINIVRRKFIAVLSGIAVAWPLAARAQQPKRVRRIGVLVTFAADDPEGRARLAMFAQGLQEAGWAGGRNVEIDTRWAASDAGLFPKHAAELIALEPDVILANSTPAVIASQQAIRTVPIVFVGVIDPVGSGLVASMPRPGGNATGFILYEYALAAKWLQMLKEVAPGVTRAAVLREQSSTQGIGQFAAIQTVAPIDLELRTVDLHDAGEIERDVAAFARESNGGLIVTASAGSLAHRELITMLAARHRLPAVYPFRYFVTSGGLISYGPDVIDQYRRAAGYVDRILKGEKAVDLPVQAPTKYELVINLKTAKAFGLTVPPSLLARADAVIE